MNSVHFCYISLHGAVLGEMTGPPSLENSGMTNNLRCRQSLGKDKRIGVRHDKFFGECFDLFIFASIWFI